MKSGRIFKRYELKYVLTAAQAEYLKAVIKEHMNKDRFGNSTICNIYFDTPDFRLIRNSIDKPSYKEKLRLRSYGVPEDDSKVFIELKKKYDSVVYKRRIGLPYGEAVKQLERGCFFGSQIADEIDYFWHFYGGLAPKMFVSYKREAFVLGEFRATFDSELLYRNYDLELTKGIYGNPITDKVIMELKSSCAIPLWLTEILSKEKIYKMPFSKYGTAYKKENGYGYI